MLKWQVDEGFFQGCVVCVLLKNLRLAEVLVRVPNCAFRENNFFFKCMCCIIFYCFRVTEGRVTCLTYINGKAFLGPCLIDTLHFI
jgi:hypothetical protein